MAIKYSFSLPKMRFGDLRRFDILLNALAIIACAYFIADFFATGIAPFIPESNQNASSISPLRPMRKDISQYQSVLARNLFNERGLIPDTDDANSDNGPPVRTALPLNLLGVIVVKNELKSVASVEDKGSNSVLAVRVNDQINPDAVVQKIEMSKVIFFNKSTGRREFVDLPQDNLTLSTRRSSGKPVTVAGGIQKMGETHFVIDRAEVDKALSNINEILTQARCVPNFENGKPSGYRCFQIVPGSIYDKLGMQDNDVICGLNGQPVNDPGRAFEVFNNLKSLNQIEICINRGGQTLNYVHDIN